MPPATTASSIVRALRAAHLHDAPRRELLQMACDKIRARGAPYTSVYAYMLSGDELVLEAVSGRDTPHTRIPVGRGVCGTAGATGPGQKVPHGTPARGHLARELQKETERVGLIPGGATHPPPPRD